MSAIILGWDPARWNHGITRQLLNRWPLPACIWSPGACGRSVAAGTDAWLLLLGAHGPGLIGHGVVLRTARAPGPAANRTDANLPCRWRSTRSCPWATRCPRMFSWRRCPASRGTASTRCGTTRRATRRASVPFGQTSSPGRGRTRLCRAPGTYPEDAVARVEVNRYERDAEARRACIAHHGTSCAACGFSFEMAYGELGADFIHVHHVVPASQLGSGYQLDPLTDLVPLCANCHAMAHHGVGSPRSVAELSRSRPAPATCAEPRSPRRSSKPNGLPGGPGPASNRAARSLALRKIRPTALDSSPAGPITLATNLHVKGPGYAGLVSFLPAHRHHRRGGPRHRCHLGGTKLMWKVAEPNEALIISGLTRGTLETRAGMDFKIVTGKGAWCCPACRRCGRCP